MKKKLTTYEYIISKKKSKKTIKEKSQPDEENKNDVSND